MSASEVAARLLAAQTSTQSQNAIFVRMEGRFAVVNIGDETVTIPCTGVYPPRSGLPVRVDWVNGSPAVTGLVTPQTPFGTITATGTPRASVLVDGNTYDLYVLQPYSPTVGDSVAVDWDRNLILGKVSGIDTPDVPNTGGGGAVPFDVTVRALDSGRYQSGSGWWGNDPWASSSNTGIWVYGNTLLDAVGSGTITEAYVFLPLLSQVGQAQVGAHDHPSLPGGAPSILPSSLITLPLGGRNGWIALTPSVGQYLAAGGRGVGVLAPGGDGNTRWAGTWSDPSSGAVRLIGIR